MPPSKNSTRQKPGLPLFDKIMLACNILASLLLLLSYLSPTADPRDFSIIAVLGFGYQVLLIVNVLFIIYWIILKSKILLLPALSVLAGVYFIAINFGFRAATIPPTKPDKQSLRVMQYNVHEFKGIDKYNNELIYDNVFNIVKDKNPDIACFEEFAITAKDSSITMDKLVKAQGYSNFYFKQFNHNIIKKGLAVFSKFPIVKYDTIASPELLNTKAIYADINYHGKTIRVYVVHLAAVEIKENQKKRILQGAVGLKNVDLIAGRLSRAFVIRSFQVSRIKNHIEDCPYPYIITGDFNDTPNSFALNELSDGIKNAFREKGSGLVTTYYSNFPKLQIDHILASNQFDVLSYQALDEKLSDHKPVITDLKLN